jgi:hypothetical protein
MEEVGMRFVAALSIAVALCSTALAGENPCLRLYIDFDPPNHVHAVGELEPYTILDAYLCADCIGVEGVSEGGFSAISFMLSLSPGMSPVVTFVDYLSNPLGIPDGSWDTGLTVWPAEPYESDPIIIGRLQQLILPDAYECIEILEHPEHGRRILDYGDPPGLDAWCVLSHGAYNCSTCPEGDPDCGCPCVTPVEAQSWGLLKALYQ